MNQTMGVVMLRLLVGADGTVKRVVITKGLPDGLDDQALKAAFELKFEPATRDGVAIDYMLSIQVEFNLR
jgi:TonB family protein